MPAILPVVSIVVPFFGLTKYILRILGIPKKELQWRLKVELLKSVPVSETDTQEHKTPKLKGQA